MFAANGVVMGSWAPQVPLLLPRLGIDKIGLGILILILGIGAVASMLFAGRLIGRFGARRVLTVFAWGLVPALPLVVASPSVLLAALTMALLGAVVGTMDVAMNANSVEVERRLGRAVMSSMHGFWSLGGFAGAALGGVLIDRFGALPHALATAAAVAATVALAAPQLWDEPPGPRTEGHRERLLPRDLALWLLGAMALFCMVPEGSVMDWGALYLKTDFAATTAESGLAYGVFAAAMAAFRFLGDRLRDRFGAVRTLRWSGIAAACGMAGAALSPALPLTLAALALCGMGVANMVPILFSAAGNHPGLPAGTAVGIVTMVGYAGILVAPFSIGWAAHGFGFRATFLTLALLLLVVVALAARARAAERAS
jgi:MFS family permease